MNNVNTAISLQKKLFDQAEALAHKKNISRSRLYSIAIEEYIYRQENQELLKRINNAYDDETDKKERTLLNKHQKHHRQIVEGEW